MKKFEERLNLKLEEALKESNDVTLMSTNQYAHGADKLSQEPSQGTVRNPNKEWFGNDGTGEKMPEHPKISSKNTKGEGPKID